MDSSKEDVGAGHGHASKETASLLRSFRPMMRPLPAWLLSLSFVGVMAGCNMLTGADALTIGKGDDDDDGETPNGGSGGQGGGQGAAGAGANDGAAGPGGSGASGAGMPVDLLPADGVTINSIVLYQGVERPLMEGGGPASTDVPVVAERDALLRVFYTTDGGFDGQQVTARLTLQGQDPIEVPANLGGGSSESDLGSTVNFEIPGQAMVAGGAYRVDLLHPAASSSGANAAATYPTSPGGMDPLEAQVTGVLTVTLVPVKYNADGSGRLPDTSAAQLQNYADLFYAMYPIADIEILVRSQPLNWGSQVSSGGNGWGDLLDAVANLRNNDGAAFNNYYYGIFEPASSFGGYCGGGCVAGLGFVGGPQDDWSHSAIGLGFGGNEAAETAVHELGHNHGREHAPCGGVSGADPSYPYSGAGIGSWGYNVLTGQLYNPQGTVDMMSYCNPTWISDYNFGNIFDRVKYVNSAASLFIPEHLANRSYQRARINEDGTLTWLSSVVLARPPIGEITDVTVDTVDGPEQVSGALMRYDHIPGGTLFVPPTNSALSIGATMTAHIDGAMQVLALP
jgi:hypothetical protein